MNIKIKTWVYNHFPYSIARLLKWGYDTLSALLKYRKPESVNHHEKCVIVFLIERTEVFSSVKSVFEAIANYEKCEVYLLPLPRSELGPHGDRMKSLAEAASFAKRLNKGTVLQTFDENTNSYFQLRSIEPDYIFLNVPYTSEYPEEYQIEELSRIAKICFIPYGYNIDNSKANYNMYSSSLKYTLFNYVSYLFCDGENCFRYCRRRMFLSNAFRGNRLYRLGFPRFDHICDMSKSELRSVLWIPRWTEPGVQGNTKSSFFSYKDSVLNFAVKHPEMQVLIRPHPLAFINFVNRRLMTQEEVDSYIETVNDLPNAFLDRSPQYEASLDKADVLLADSSSIIIEFFLRNKPIIYLGNKKELSRAICDVTDSFYYAKDWEEVENLLMELKNGNDPKKELRTKAIRNFSDKKPDAGKRIADFLVDEFFNQ